MAKRKEEQLSSRQRQSKKIMRDKEILLRRQYLFHKLKIFSLGFLIIAIIGISAWSWKTSAFSKGIELVASTLYGITAKAGYSLQNVYLEGRNRTPLTDINKALNIDKNYPILRLSLYEIRTRLEQIPSVKLATVERALPDTLFVKIVEREPVALWQYQGKIALVDDNGVVMDGLDMTPYKELPLIVGEGAPKQVTHLIMLLVEQPELKERFVAGVWVGERRWNIKLKPSKHAADNAENIEVRLPEKNSNAAWKQLAELQKKQHVLDRNIKVIDLRIDGRLFIKLPSDEIEPDSKTSDLKDS